MAGGTIGDRIKKLREERGFSASDLARLTGVSPAAVANWEQRERTPRAATLAAICQALGTTEDHIMRGKLNGAVPQSARRTVDQVLETARDEIADIMGVSRPSVTVSMMFDKAW